MTCGMSDTILEMIEYVLVQFGEFGLTKFDQSQLSGLTKSFLRSDDSTRSKVICDLGYN